MREFYYDVFENYVMSLAKTQKVFDLTDLIIFEQTLQIYRPMKSDSGQLMMLNLEILAYQQNINNYANNVSKLPFLKEEFWKYTIYLF